MAYDFKKEEDVQEFLKNLGIEYRFACYHEKDPEGCHRLGEYFEAIKRDFKKAAIVFSLNCDDYKHGRSCYKYGNYSFLGKGCDENKARALDYFKKGCNSKSHEACYHAGLMLTSDDKNLGINKNNLEGVNYLEKACEYGSALGCYHLSACYITGRGSILKDMKKAFEATKKGCELGNIYACTNLSQMYKRGEGVEKDEKLADFYRRKVLDEREQLTKPKRTLQFEQFVNED